MRFEDVESEGLKLAYVELPKLNRERTINMGLIRCVRVGLEPQDYYPPPPKKK